MKLLSILMKSESPFEDAVSKSRVHTPLCKS